MQDSDAPQCQDSTSNNAEHPQKGGPSGVTPQGDTKPDNCDSQSYHHAPKAKWWHRIDWSQVILDTLLLVVGIKLAYIYSSQLGQMVEQNRISRTATAVSQRAYLIFPPDRMLAQPGILPTGKKTFVFVPIIDNGGNTPAFNVLHKINDNGPKFGDVPTEFSDNPTPTNPKDFLFKNMDDSKSGEIILGPHGQTGAGGLNIEDDILLHVNDGTKHVFLWGWTTYRDVFGCTHKTEFCQQVVSLTIDNSGAAHYAVSECRKHNCADQDCSDYVPTGTPVCALEREPLK